MRLWVLIFSLLFLSTAYAQEKAEGEGGEAIQGPEYIEMTPKFTVNLADPKQILLVNVQLLAEDAITVNQIKKNMPALRHEMIMLFSGLPADDIQTMEQREALRQKATEIIRETLDNLDEGHHSSKHNEGFKEAFFTEFLID